MKPHGRTSFEAGLLSHYFDLALTERTEEEYAIAMSSDPTMAKAVEVATRICGVAIAPAEYVGEGKPPLTVC